MSFPKLLSFRHQLNRVYISLQNPIIILFFVSLLLRFLYLFFFQLIPGVNGGYYPLQVKALFYNGSLAFPDAPLVFYINASLIFFFSVLGIDITDSFIIHVVKITDALFIPFTIFPLTWIFRKISPQKNISPILLIFTLFSFAPLTLIADLQKQSLATLWFCLLLASYIQFHYTRKLQFLFIASALLILIALTHVGIFILSILMCLILILLLLREQQIWRFSSAILVISGLGIALMYFYDKTRFNRLVEFWQYIFHQPLFSDFWGPFEFMSFGLSVFVIMVSVAFILKRKHLQPLHKNLVFASALVLLLCSLPVLDVEYFRRFALFLYIPQSLLIAIVLPNVQPKYSSIIKFALCIYIFLSIFLTLSRPKLPVLTYEAQQELKSLCQHIKTNNRQAIVISPHGIEWWIAWFCQVHVAQPHQLHDELFSTYSFIYQVVPAHKIMSNLPPPNQTKHQQPAIYKQKPVWAGKYFSFYQLSINVK